jgi:Flp pilus assembly protein TadB
VDTHQRQTGGWTIALVCLGLGILACAFLLPQSQANARLAHEVRGLRADLDHLKTQVETNDEFLRRVGEDQTLMERLAQRQMRYVRPGSTVLDLGEKSGLLDRSPFALVSLPVPPPPPEYQPRQTRLAQMFRDPGRRLYLIAGGLMLLAIGLVCGGSPPASVLSEDSEPA